MNLMKTMRQKRKQAASQNAATPPAENNGRVMLDYPQSGETVNSPSYTFRVGTSGDMERVEILIQQGAWQLCRHAEGYWWHDWSGYGDGEYHVAARAHMRDGRVIIAEPREFRVALPRQA